MKKKRYKSSVDYREVVIKLLKEDKKTFLKFHDEPLWLDLQPLLTDAFDHIYLHFGTRNIDDIFEDEKFAFAKGAVTETVRQKK